MIKANDIYKGEFKYKSVDGSDAVLVLKPLPVKHLGKLFDIARKFQNSKDNPDGIIDKMDEETVSKMAELCLAALEVSCPDVDPVLREQFVTSHFSNLIGAVFSTNIRG